MRSFSDVVDAATAASSKHATSAASGNEADANSADRTFEAVAPVPPAIHGIHDELGRGAYAPGRVRTLLRTLSPNDLHGLKSLTPALAIAVARVGTAAELLMLRYEFGFDWWAPYADAGTCLHAAAGAGNDEVLELLLSYVPDETRADAPSSVTGRTPLHFAAAGGHVSALTTLVDGAGAGVDARDKSGDTALHHACRSQQRLAVLALLERGADKTAVNRRGHAPWVAAVEACDLELVQLVYAPLAGAAVYLTGAQFAVSSTILSDLQTSEILRVLHGLGEPLDVTSVTGVDLYHLALRKDKPVTADFIATVVRPAAVVPLPFR